MSEISRRKLITAGLTTAAGAAGLTAAVRLADRTGLLPPGPTSLYTPGDTLTYAAQRLLTRHTLAREFRRDQISPQPFPNPTSRKSDEYKRLEAGGFAEWRLTVEGLVERPMTFSLADLKGFPVRSQITSLACEEGWSYVAEWTGVPLSLILERVGTMPQARYVTYHSIQRSWADSIDMDDALHPQTLVTHTFNGADLPYGHGGPLRMRVPRQLGYKSVKFINRIRVVDSLKPTEAGGSYSWYAGI
ncbi:MAG: molybdopterin-dependent oxidoreductase [Acidobacteria bacterium]|nr:molybdopterin-dependent oxidoreductase [Acidobacteriota bacterium]